MANSEENAIMEFFGRDALNDLPVLNANNALETESCLDIPDHLQETIDEQVALFVQNEAESNQLEPNEESPTLMSDENLAKDENGFILLGEGEEEELLAETPRSKYVKLKLKVIH